MSKTSLAQRILAEDLLTLKDAAREVPRPEGAKPLHYATVNRWVRRGVRGTRLPAIKIGQQFFTSRQRLAAFLEATQETVA